MSGRRRLTRLVYRKGRKSHHVVCYLMLSVLLLIMIIAALFLCWEVRACWDLLVPRFTASGGLLGFCLSFPVSLAVSFSLSLPGLPVSLSLVEQKGRELASELSAPRTNLGWRRRVGKAGRDAMSL